MRIWLNGSCTAKIAFKESCAHGHALRLFNDSFPLFSLTCCRVMLDSFHQFPPHYRALCAREKRKQAGLERERFPCPAQLGTQRACMGVRNTSRGCTKCYHLLELFWNVFLGQSLPLWGYSLTWKSQQSPECEWGSKPQSFHASPSCPFI